MLYEKMVKPCVEFVEQKKSVTLYQESILKKKIDLALDALQKSADKGYTEGEFLLGNIYYNGEFVQKDLDKAFKLWREHDSIPHTGNLSGTYCNAKL